MMWTDTETGWNQIKANTPGNGTPGGGCPCHNHKFHATYILSFSGPGGGQLIVFLIVEMSCCDDVTCGQCWQCSTGHTWAPGHRWREHIPHVPSPPPAPPGLWLNRGACHKLGGLELNTSLALLVVSVHWRSPGRGPCCCPERPRCSERRSSRLGKRNLACWPSVGIPGNF